MNSGARDSYYSLEPGVEVVPSGEADLVFRLETHTVRIAGDSAPLFARSLLPVLDGEISLDALAERLPGLGRDELQTFLDRLVEFGVLRATAVPLSAEAPAAAVLAPMLAALAQLGCSRAAALQRLRSACVAVAGLEAHGAHLAALLARCGVGTLSLVDPYPCEAGDLPMLPPLSDAVVGRHREEVVRELVAQVSPGTRVRIGGGAELSEEVLRAAAADADLLVACFGRGFGSGHLRAASLSLAVGVPVLHASAWTHTAVIGPLTLPKRGACYLCWRMRTLACAADVAEALRFEEHLNGQTRPALHAGALLPSLPPLVAGHLLSTVLTHVLELPGEPLIDRVVEVDGRGGRYELHPVLPRPDCPLCGPHRGTQSAGKARTAGGTARDILDLADALVDARTGVVSCLSLLDPVESQPLPFVYTAVVSNARYDVGSTDFDRMCSGKGTTPAEARASTLGEAVERYSALCWDPDRVLRARRAELARAALHPAELVLYAPDQYLRLPYAPYSEATPLGWVQARSLVARRSLMVPAFAVFLDYEFQTPEERLAPLSSTGLATAGGAVEATLSALLEVLERDAFLLTWMHRLPASRLHPASHPDAAVRALHSQFHEAGVELCLNHLPTDHPAAVVIATLLDRHARPGSPAAAVGVGADLSVSAAARRAVLEAAQVRTGLLLRLASPDALARAELLAASPSLVQTAHDHALRYTSPSTLPAFQFLLDGSPTRQPWDGPAPPPLRGLICLLRHFRRAGTEVLHLDLTPPDIASLGLYTARILVPGFQPMHFGADEPRLGGARLLDFPRRVGLARRQRITGRLNPNPHPFS